MTAVSISVSDLEPFAVIEDDKAQAMVDDALAMAARVAPCINDDDFAYPEAARAILRGAILRWHEAGNGALQSQTVGPFGQVLDTRVQRRSMFFPSEITDLQGLCAGDDVTGKAFSIDTGTVCTLHLPWCASYFGAVYCSCGVDIAGYPIFELG